MQAVILAAGRGTRMGALTEDTPKPLLRINGRPILEHILDALPDEIDEVIIVVGYLGSLIQKHFGGLYKKGTRILYVEQNVLNGTAGALWSAKDLLKDKFLVMNGDDICRADDMQACASSPDWALLVQDVEEVGSSSLVVVDERGCVTDILEKEVHKGGTGLANTANFFLLDTRVFSYNPVYRPGSNTEFGLPQTVVQAAKDIPIHPIEAHSLIRITEPEDLQKAQEILTNQG
ncbi:MAG TPA: nucleotidyltransferase family protein [Candidatus Paceibacterota bacterium]|nr:nucleotidyltransferase family protein [Candidatus Paceibacterota bacterium]